jgi:hypothetical protein
VGHALRAENLLAMFMAMIALEIRLHSSFAKECIVDSHMIEATTSVRNADRLKGEQQIDIRVKECRSEISDICEVLLCLQS